MLGLMIRNFYWLAWWPVRARLLTLEKAAERRAEAEPSSVSHEILQRSNPVCGEAAPAASKTDASDD
jgi:hypothetical protein